MIWNDILAIFVMLILSALFGFLIGWFMKDYKLERLEGYGRAMEDKVNRINEKLIQTERELIDCQTNRKKSEAEMAKLEQKINSEEETETEQKESEQKEKKPDKKETKKLGTEKKKEKPDDLKKIEGIGPKIARILIDAGIDTFLLLSEQSSARISEILIAAGGNSYNRFNPETWPQQAKLASDGKWDELSKWQDELKGGRKN